MKLGKGQRNCHKKLTRQIRSETQSTDTQQQNTREKTRRDSEEKTGAATKKWELDFGASKSRNSGNAASKQEHAAYTLLGT